MLITQSERVANKNALDERGAGRTLCECVHITSHREDVSMVLAHGVAQQRLVAVAHCVSHVERVVGAMMCQAKVFLLPVGTETSKQSFLRVLLELPCRCGAHCIVHFLVGICHGSGLIAALLLRAIVLTIVLVLAIAVVLR
jgi:hypothetical protein